MKKAILLFTALAAFVALQAQWVDDPMQNTFLVNSSSEAGEVYLSTDIISGDTYVQFSQMRSNGWVPTLQRLSFEGVPQWGNEGITITGQTLATWSQGVAMAATNDGGVVSCFSNAADQSIAVRINADGTLPWGEQGVVLFDGQGGSRTELLAGDDGSVWALGTDLSYSYLQYVSSDGTLGQLITLGDGNKGYTFGQMVPGPYNTVFVVFEKQSWAYTYFYEKELWVVGFSPEGGQIAPEAQLMTNFTMGGSYAHYVVPDGANGGYAYMWHAGIGDAFNTYVFHFDEYGNSTISDMNGCAVHSTDPSNYYLDAYGTVDPISHDLIIAFEQTDANTQSQSRIFMNRITSTGERLWGEGILAVDDMGDTYSNILVDAFEDGSGFSLIYTTGDGYNSTVEAIGFDMDGNQLWNTQMSSGYYPKSMCKNSTGFVMGQNVVAWANSSNGGIYGQNIGINGEMGQTPPPVPCCFEPTNFDGAYYYDEETGEYGALLTWEAPSVGAPEHYNLYVTDPVGCMTTVEIAGDKLEYFDVTSVIGAVRYQLTAVHNGNESAFAQTATGEDYLLISITGIGEHNLGEMTSVLKIYTMSGQCLKHNNVNELNNGIYLLQGLTEDGKMVSKKVVVYGK